MRCDFCHGDNTRKTSFGLVDVYACNNCLPQDPIETAYDILKTLKGWNLRSLDEQGEMCVVAGKYIADDHKFIKTLRMIVAYYNVNLA